MTTGDHFDDRDHLFISYAWEDGALAEWLTLRLTAEGYKVWCDRFKLLGGESWPEDIDQAIKRRTFRMLHVVSKHSLHKPNPTKERTLALALQKERNSEFFIPLNADGTKPTALPWQISDIVFIPFQNWGDGLRQLLEKLRKVAAPRPLTEGRGIAAGAMTAPSVILNQPEVIYSNCFPFVALPEAILRFTTKQVDADRIADGLALQWPHRYLRNGTFLSLVAPPPKNEDARFLVPFGGVSWRDVDRVGGLSTDRLLIELLNKHLAWKLRTLGLKQMVEGRSYATVYFPESLVPKNRLPLQLPNQRKTWVTTCGRLRSGAGHFRYNLAFALEARRLDDGHFAQMGLKAQIRDDIGNIVEGRHSFSRGRRVRRTWWNRQQLVRQAGIAAFLAQGDPSISLWEYANTDLAIAAAPSTFLIGTAIDESAPALSGEDVAPIEHDEVLLESERED